MTKIKICGVSSVRDVMCANELLLDYVGFIFYDISRRYVDDAKAALLKAYLKPSVKAVGVFVDDSIDRIAKLVDDNIIDVVQLHGSQPKAFVEDLRYVVHVPMIQAYRVESERDVNRVNATLADYALVDHGQDFDFSLLGKIEKPYFLAGGLNPGNVGGLVEAYRPYAVDTSAGVESFGRKDYRKMQRFAMAVR